MRTRLIPAYRILCAVSEKRALALCPAVPGGAEPRHVGTLDWRRACVDREAVSEIVRHSLDEVFANLRRESAGAGEWTKEVKTQLCLAGAAQQPKLHVCAEGVESRR